MNWGISIKMKLTTRLINISFRGFTSKELDRVLAIEHLAYDTPWSKTQFINSLNNPQAFASLLVVDGQVLGYFVALRALDSADLLNICIHPDHQQQGLGVQLFDHLVQQLQTLNLDTIFIEVRVSNKSALSFYQTLGFEVIAKRKKYYSNLEDAKILRLQMA